MKYALLLAVAVLLGGIVPLRAAEPIVGTWRLEQQEINGQKVDAEPMTLKVSQSGDKLAFAFSVPVNNVYFVSMSYTVKLDGSEAEVKNAQGEKLGSIRLKSDGRSQYTLSMRAPNRPDSNGKLTVSADGKVLTSEADSMQGGRAVHSRQTYSRY